ncbi:MAG TPA: hypothetical protein VNN12_00105 [Dehalococcoidia bacterium]|nr:hypothetical protein [Dehalococcoidia bacterium]
MIAAMIAAPSFVPVAHAAVLCRSKAGAVRVRDEACRKRETPLDPATLGLAPAGHTHDDRYYPTAQADQRFLGSERVLSGSVQWVIQPVGTVLFRDAATGLEVRSASQGRPRFLNTNDDGTSLLINGVGWFTPGSLYGFSSTVAQGASVDVTFDAVGFQFGTFMVVKLVDDGTPAPRLQVTCAFRDSMTPAQVVLSCVGVR